MYNIEDFLKYRYKEQFENFDFSKHIRPWSLYAFNDKVSTGSLPLGLGKFYVHHGNVDNLNYTENLKVSSTSAHDTDSDAAEGARRIVMEGIAGDPGQGGGRLVQEIVSLDGQTAVTTVNKFSVVNFASIQHIGMGATQNLSNKGIIYIGKGSVSSGVNAEPVTAINTNAGVTENGLYMVPRDKRLYVTKLMVNLLTLGKYSQNTAVFSLWTYKRNPVNPTRSEQIIATGTKGNYDLTLYPDYDKYSYGPRRIYTGQVSNIAGNDSVTVHFKEGIMLMPKESVYILIDSVGTTCAISGKIDGYLEDYVSPAKKVVKDSKRRSNRLRSPETVRSTKVRQKRNNKAPNDFQGPNIKPLGR